MKANFETLITGGEEDCSQIKNENKGKLNLLSLAHGGN